MSRPAQDGVQRAYWSRARFRGPDHPAVVAYATPKVEFLSRHASLEGRTVLDVGCGNGIFSVPLAHRAGRVVAVDLAEHMLHGNPHPLRIRASALALPFADRAFDVVFAANLLHHVDDVDAVLREMGRCSARHLMLVEPNRLNPLMFGLGLLVPAERGTLRSSRPALISWVEAAGFRIIAVTTTGMISQNNTPEFLVPWLRRFDCEIALGEYVVLCSERR